MRRHLLGAGLAGLAVGTHHAGGFATACAEKHLEPIVEGLRSQLVRVGGICLDSDAEWVVL